MTNTNSRSSKPASLRLLYFILLALLLGLSNSNCFAQDSAGPYSSQARSSPKSAWGDFTIEERKVNDPWYVPVLLWIPNRALDFIDIFHLDVGIGPTIGAVARVSKYAQVGYRSVNPVSVRYGALGRQAPALVERSDEYGIGPGFVASRDRRVCPGEVGLGVDLGLGIYGGVCLDQLVDFVAGVFFLDVSKDDLR